MSMLSGLASPYAVGGGSPFGSSTPTSYSSAYQNYLGAANSIYNSIIGAYNTQAAQNVGAENSTLAGYTTLGKDVMQTIQGITASQSQAIADAYAQQTGATTQQMINSGLGNSTVLASQQQGNLLQEQKANVALANQQAQLEAGYQSQIGLAGLNAKQQFIGMNTGFTSNLMGNLSQINVQPPDAMQWAMLQAMQRAQTSQTNTNPGVPGTNFGQPQTPPGNPFAGGYASAGGGGGGFDYGNLGGGGSSGTPTADLLGSSTPGGGAYGSNPWALPASSGYDAGSGGINQSYGDSTSGD
jgi:hypothetical protein